jgi:CheY-like chemotaxis protein
MKSAEAARRGLMAESYQHALPELSFGDHACLIFESEREQIQATALFLAVGLDRGERCVFVAPPPALEAVRLAMTKGGVDAVGEMAGGRLILTGDRDFLDRGYWSTPKMLGFLKEAYERALADGFNGLRATGDVSWQVGPSRSFAQIPLYESMLDRFFAGKRMIGLCQYPKADCPPEALSGVLQTHPIAAVEGVVRRNVHYLPPSVLLENNHDLREKKRAEWKLAQLTEKPKSAGGPKILLVDDEQVLHTVLIPRLESLGYSVLSVTDGDEALRLFELEKPDVVLMDVRLPTLDGLEVLREMIGMDPDAKVIIISGHVTNEQARLALAEGACDFIPKPIDLDYLETCLEVLAATAAPKDA